MSLLRRLKGGHRKSHYHVNKDDPVEMSTSASDGNSPEKQQGDEHHHHHHHHLALHLGSNKSSKQKAIGVEGDNNNIKGPTASAPLTPPPQPAPPPPGNSASKRSASRSLFKRRHRGVSTSPSRANDVKNGGKDDNNTTINGGSDIINHAASAHLEEEEATVAALTKSLLCFTPSRTGTSRSGVNHLPPTPEAVPLNMELQFPISSATTANAAATPQQPPGSRKAPTTPSPPPKSKATLPPATPASAAQPPAPPPPSPHPRSALAEVTSSYAEKSARLAAHKAHWWSLFSHTHHHHSHSNRGRHKNKRNNGAAAATTTAAAAASSLPPRSSPRHISSFSALRSSSSSVVYSPTAASAASDSPQHVLITTDSDLLNDPDYRNKISKEAAALDKEGNEFFQQGNYDDAFLCYEKAMTLKRQSLYVTNQQLIKQDDDDDNASVASQVTVDSKASILASVATSINNMTYLKQRAGLATAEETMAAYLKSLQIKRDILGPNHLSVGKTLNNIGSVFYIKREFEAALKAYESAHEIMAAQLGTEHLDVGTVISNIGDVKSAMETGDGRNKKDAMEYYRRALDIRWKALGPNDPKVIRLMEQLAWLETGKQPQKLDEELSDSEDEEFATEDRQRHEAFQEDVRVLQEELAQDMKFFDLLERKMAIDMVKDKTRCFRELRELQQELELSNHNNNNISPLHGATATAAATPWDEETTDNTDGSDAILTTVSAPPNMAPTAAAAAYDSETTPAVKKIGNFVDRSNNNHNNSDQHQQPSPSLSSFLEKADAAATAAAAAAGSSPSGLISLHETRPTPPGMRKGTLTAKERKEALTSVRARLAALRASRDPDESDVTENDDCDDTGKLIVSINDEDKKKYNGNDENSDWLRKQQTQAVQQHPDSTSSRNPLEDGLVELTMEINRVKAGSFRMSTSPGVLPPSLPIALDNADNDISDDESHAENEGECSDLQNNNNMQK